MTIYSKLSNVRKLTNSSLNSIIDVSNLNFNDIADATLEFLNSVSYNENTNSIDNLYQLDSNYINISEKLNVTLNGVSTFTIDSQGRAEGNSFLVEVAEAKRYRHTDFNDWPDVGIVGEIIYTGVQNQKPEFGEDFIGYLDGRGWVSLTQGNGSSTVNYLTLQTYDVGSPPIGPYPPLGSGIVWIGYPGLETTETPTTQDLYFTDENGEIFRLTCCGGGGGSSIGSFVAIESFTANVPLTINHNLNSDDIIVQLIDIATGELIEGNIDNYLTNSVDIELTNSLLGVKIVILAADSTGGGGGGGTQGPQGPQGPAGANGTAATISILPTVTGLAGTSASVVNQGTSNIAELEFTIPVGNDGPQGPPGPVGAAGLNFIGNWNSTTSYLANDVAFFNGSSYVAINAVGPVATDPSIDTANWNFLALQGLQGPQGVQGQTGLQGIPGLNAWSPTVNKSIPLDNPIDLVGGKTFLITATADTTIDVINPSVGDYTFIIDNSGGHIITLQSQSIFYTNNSLQPVISGVTMMKLFYDGSRMFVTSLENMQLA